MNKKLFSALLCGVVMFSASVFSSCNDDKNLDTRLRILEGKFGELQSQLSAAVASGKTIKSAVQAADGSWTLTLSDGTTVIRTGTGGGSSVTVTIENGNAIITVGDKEYVIPMGSAVSSLIYRPQYTDGIVMLGNADPTTDAGATVKFLATPAVSAEALQNATFDIADIYKLQARTRVGGGGLIRAKGAATLDGDGYINVPLKGLTVEPGESYSVSVQMNISGTSISSNYFTVQVAGDFAFDAEDIGGTELNSEYKPVAVAGDAYEITVNGLELLDGTITDFSDFFTTLPDGAEFQVAPQAQQPNSQAKDKYGILNSSLKADGSFAFSSRPGANFNVTEGQSGFQFNVVVNDQVKAKTYVKINDPIAEMDFVGTITAETEAEYGGRTNNNANGHLTKGAQTFDLQKSFFSYSIESEQNNVDWVIIHRGRAEFFGSWADFSVGDILFNDGERLVLGGEGKKYAVLGSRGIYWFLKGFTIASPIDSALKDEQGNEYAGDRVILDRWGPQGTEYTGSVTTMDIALPYVSIDPVTGVLSFTEKYTGFSTRLAVGACYEYAYGVKKLGHADQFGLFFFNRRQWPEDALMPTL